MRGAFIRIGLGVALLTTLLLVLVVVVPSRRTLLIEVYELVLGAIGVATLVSSFRTLEPKAWLRSPFERGPEKPEPTPVIPELDRIDRLVVLGTGNEFDLHYRLRPVLRQIAADRLYARDGIDLDREPERARARLGDELWALLDPERKLGRRVAVGIDPAELTRDVERLERL